MENSNDTIGNRTRDLPACSAVPQPTAPPRAPDIKSIRIKKVNVPVQTMRASIGTASKVLNLGIRCRCVDSFTLWSMSPPVPRNVAWHPFNMRLDGYPEPI